MPFWFSYRVLPCAPGPSAVGFLCVRPGNRLVGAYLPQGEFTLRQGAGDDHVSGMAR